MALLPSLYTVLDGSVGKFDLLSDLLSGKALVQQLKDGAIHVVNIRSSRDRKQ